MKKTLAFALLFACSAFAQRAEFPVERPVTPVRIEALTNGVQPLIASDGHAFLAAWTLGTDQGSYGQMFIARIDANGTLLDPEGIALGEGFASDLIWTGQSYLLAAYIRPGWDVLSIDANANVLAHHHVGVGTHADERYRIRLATNGTNAMLAGWNGVFVRLDLNGRSLGSSRFSGQFQQFFDVASNGRDYLVAFTIGGELFARSLGAASVRGDIIKIRGERLFTALEVEHAEDGYLVSWTANGVYAQLVDDNAQPAGERQTVQEIASTATAYDLGALRAGNEIIITNSVGLSLYETRVNLRGQPVTESRVFGLGRMPDVAQAGATTAYVWRESRGVIQSAVSHARGAVEQVNVLSRGTPAQSAPQLARAGDDVVAVWREQHELRIARVGGEPQTVAQFIPPYVKFDVVSDGRFVWVAWRDEFARAVLVRRYTPALEPLDAVPMEIRVPRDHAADWKIVAGLQGVLVIWRLDKGGFAIPGSRVESAVAVNAITVDGTVLRIHDPVTIAETETASRIAGAWTGNEYVVAWTVRETGTSRLLATRLTRDAVMIDPVPLIVTEQQPDILDLHATRATDYGVAFTWRDLAGTVYTTRATIFRGDPLPPVRVLRTSHDIENVVAFVTVPDGYVLVHMAFAHYGTHVQRYDVNLAPRGERRRVIEALVSDVIAVGDDLHFGYTRPSASFEGITRAYVGSFVDIPRRRVVR